MTVKKNKKKMAAAVGLVAVSCMTVSGLQLPGHADQGGGGGTGTWNPGNSQLTSPRWYVNSSDPDPVNKYGKLGDVNSPSGVPGTAWYKYTHSTQIGGNGTPHTIADVIDNNLGLTGSDGVLYHGLDAVWHAYNVDPASQSECLSAQRVFNLGDKAYTPVVQYASLADNTDTRTYDNWSDVTGNDMVQKFNSYDADWRNQNRVNDLINNADGSTPQPILICLDQNAIEPQDRFNGTPNIDIEKYFDDMGNGSGPTYDADGNVTNDGYASDFDNSQRMIDPSKTYPIRFTISNNGTEVLKNTVVTDELTGGNGKIENLNCTFPDGSQGTTWNGDFQPAARFDCTGTLPALGGPSLTHSDTATVNAVGRDDNTPVSDSDNLNANTPTPHTDIQKYFPDLGAPTYDAAGNVTNDGFPGDFDTALRGLDGTKSYPVEFSISNNGTEDLTNITVADKLDSGSGTLQNLSCTFPDGSKGLTWNGVFSVGTQFKCTATLPALGNPKDHSDTASINATGVLSKVPVSSTDKLHGGTPNVDIEKYSKEDGTPKYDAAGNVTNDGYLGDFDNTYKSMKGDQPLSFTISNNGYEPLTNIKVTDKVTEGKGTIKDLNCTFPDGKTGTTWDGVLDVAKQFNCTATITGLTPGEKHTDIATIDAVGVNSKQSVTDKDTWKGQEPTPHVNIEKWSDGEEKPTYDPKTGKVTNDQFKGDYDSKPKYVPGSEKIHFTISNDGTEPLVNLKLTDKTLAGNNNVENIKCTFPDGTTGTEWKGPFEVNKQFDCTGDLKSVDLGTFHSDLGTINAVGEYTKAPVSDKDLWNGENPNPSIDIQKYNNGEDTPKYDAKGNVTNNGFNGDYDTSYKNVTSQDTAITMTVSNNGTEDLTHINVSDKTTEGNVQIKDLNCTFPDGKTGTSWDGILPIGKQFNCTGVVPKLDYNANHTDQSLVTANGVLSGKPVTANDVWKAHNTDQPPVAPKAPVHVKTGEASTGVDPIALTFGSLALVGAAGFTGWASRKNK